MFRKENLMKNIISRLTVLTDYVRQNNKLGWTDVNHGAEDFYCGLLNTAFGWKLKNQNELKMDFPAIDLGDSENRICVQVTSTTERSKVQRTLYKFFGNGLNEQYSRLIVLIIGEKPDYRSGFRVEEGFAFDPQADIWDLAVLNEKLNALEVDELEQVSQYLDKQLNLPAVNLPTLNLPLSGALEKGHFVGREAELATLAEKLGDPGSRKIFVTGLGGMGKTELVKRFCADYTGGRVYFALFQDNFTDTVALRMAQGLPGYQDRKPDPERDYQEVLELLRSCGPEDILVIDNADEPEGNFSKLAADPAWEELTKLPLRLIITTRCSVDRAVKAGAIAKESLRKIFDNHGLTWLPASEKDALIGAVGDHTMTVDLMARTLKHNQSLKVERLLEAMRSGTLPEQKYRPVGVDRDGDSSQAQIYVHLKNLFHVAELSENDRKLLRWAVLLPEGGMKLEYLLKALPEELKTQPDAQIDRCWLSFDRETELVTLHPVLRLVCREELQPNDENCGQFLGAVWDQFSRIQYDAVKYRQFAELFSRAAEQLPDTEADWAVKAGVLWNQVGLAANARRYNEQAVRRLEETMPGSRELAAAYNNVGHTYGALGDHNKALEYKLKALAICEKVLPGDHPDLVLSYNNVGGTYGDLGDHNKALEYQLKALAIREKVLPGDHPDLAASYNNVGYTYGDLGDHNKALEYKLKALAIWEKVLPEDHPNLASSYDNVGSTYGDLGDHNKALEYKLKALAIREKVLPANQPDLAASYNNVGYSYGQLGNTAKKLDYYIKALAIREKVLPGNHPSLAISYNNVGSTYGDLGDHGKSLEYQLKALAIREKVLSQDHPSLALSYCNVGATYFALGDLPRVVSCLEKAVDIARRSLPEGHPHREQYQRDLAYVQKLMQQK